MAQSEQINPAILTWARETAGLSVDDAAQKLSIITGDAAAKIGNLLELERGERLPSRAQLDKIAKTYRRPLLTFYLAAPPKKSERGSDFRTTGAEVSERENGLLDAVIRDVQARQEMLASVLEDEDELEQLPFVASCSVQDNPEKLADLICKALHLPPSAEGRPSSPEGLFKFLRAGIEALGVYVLLIGDLGSHHSALSEEVFRGFALADPRVPFIVINDHDAKTARSFTLIHELVHIYLGESGISGTPEQAQGNSATAKVEQFCNETASYVLLPKDFEKEKPEPLRGADSKTTLQYVEKTAKVWTVSEPLVAFRFRRLGWITPTVYAQLRVAYAQRWQEQKASTKAKQQSNEGGPNYYTVKQYRLGNALIEAVRRTVRENRLTHTKAAKILSVKPGAVESVFRHYEKHSYALGERG